MEGTCEGRICSKFYQEPTQLKIRTNEKYHSVFTFFPRKERERSSFESESGAGGFQREKSATTIELLSKLNFDSMNLYWIKSSEASTLSHHVMIQN